LHIQLVIEKKVDADDEVPYAFDGRILLNALTEMWEPSRDFDFLRLPTAGARTIIAISGCVEIVKLAEFHQLTLSPIMIPSVMVLSSEGYPYVYNIDLENGGEYSPIKQYK